MGEPHDEVMRTWMKSTVEVVGWPLIQSEHHAGVAVDVISPLCRRAGEGWWGIRRLQRNSPLSTTVIEIRALSLFYPRHRVACVRLPDTASIGVPWSNRRGTVGDSPPKYDILREVTHMAKN